MSPSSSLISPSSSVTSTTSSALVNYRPPYPPLPLPTLLLPRFVILVPTCSCFVHGDHKHVPFDPNKTYGCTSAFHLVKETPHTNRTQYDMQVCSIRSRHSCKTLDKPDNQVMAQKCYTVNPKVNGPCCKRYSETLRSFMVRKVCSFCSQGATAFVPPGRYMLLAETVALFT
jgi:hypothetical protein